MSQIWCDFSLLVVHCSTPTLFEKENPTLDHLDDVMLVDSMPIPFERRELGSPGEGVLCKGLAGSVPLGLLSS